MEYKYKEGDIINPSVFENRKYYKWVSGPNKGLVEVYVAKTDNEHWFESGRYCNVDKFETDMVESTEFDYNYNNTNLNNSTTSNNHDNILLEPIKEDKQIEIKHDEINPITLILNKQKSNNEINIQIDYKISIPTKNVLDILNVMFDEDEVKDEIIKQIINRLDINDIKNNLITEIKNKLNE